MAGFRQILAVPKGHCAPPVGFTEDSMHSWFDRETIALSLSTPTNSNYPPSLMAAL